MIVTWRCDVETCLVAGESRGQGRVVGPIGFILGRHVVPAIDLTHQCVGLHDMTSLTDSTAKRLYHLDNATAAKLMLLADCRILLLGRVSIETVISNPAMLDPSLLASMTSISHPLINRLPEFG